MLFIEPLLPVAEIGEEVMSQQEKGEHAQNVAELKGLNIDQSNKIKYWLPILADLLRQVVTVIKNNKQVKT